LAQEQIEKIEEDIQAPIQRRQAEEPLSNPMRLGEKVLVRSLKLEGVVTSIGESDVEVQIGVLRVRARQGDIRRKGEEGEPLPVPAPVPTRGKSSGMAKTSAATPFYPSPGMELDIRGQRAEDGLDALDRYLESAFMAGLLFVRIIHGKGTGRLRQVVREALQNSPHVSRWENGQDKEGGEGVTVAHLRKD
jgi:DNA mismatch repair protein MutS2